ncbi:UNVERIFIED_CONTAM: hypothetical protein HDU68_010926 [Siphonaria sp. JEL0065]|nr:hypothetical protein HDU68_010926 [Siphonaria sp. JEL0065]
MEAVLGAYDPDSDDLSFTDGLSYDSEDDYDAGSNFYNSDDNDEDVVVDVPYVHEFMEGELEVADWSVIDNLQLAFITSCKISAEQENPDYSVIKLVLMQNTLKKIYDDWAANAPESDESPIAVQNILSLSDAQIDEVNQLEPIVVAPWRASLNANIPPKSEEIIIPQRTATSRVQQTALSSPPSPPKDSIVIPPDPASPAPPAPITLLDSAFDAYLTLTLDDLAQSAGTEKEKGEPPATSNVDIPTRPVSHGTTKSEAIPISISAGKDSISSKSTNSSSDKPLTPPLDQLSSKTQQTELSPLPSLSNSPPTSSHPSVIIQPRTHSRKANAIIMNSINQPIKTIPIKPRGIPSRQRQQIEPPLALQEEYSFLSKYYLTNSLLPPRNEEEQEGALHRNPSITSSIMRANSVGRRPSKLTVRSSSASMSITPTTPTTPSSFSSSVFQNYIPAPSRALAAVTPLVTPPATPTPPPRKKIVRNKPLPTPPTSIPSIFPIDDVRGAINGVDENFCFDARSREELSLLTRSNSVRSTGTKTSRNSSRLSVPGGGEWAESVVNTFLQRASVFLGSGAGAGGTSVSMEWSLEGVENGGKVVTEKRSRSLKRGSGKVKSTGSGDLFAMYQEHGGGGSQSGSPISAVLPPVPPGPWNLGGSSVTATAVASGGVAQIPTRSSSRIVNPVMESSLMAKYQLLAGQQQVSQKNK